MRDAEPPTSPASADKAPYVIASALRTLDVLRAFARPPHRLGLAEVTVRLRLERNQAYRSLKTLEAAGFLVATEDARFELGPAAAGLGTAALPLHAGAVPKAMLAWLPDDQQRSVLEGLNELPTFTERTYRDAAALAAELAAIRERGHSYSDEDFDASARGVGAPIFDASGAVVAGVSVGGPSYRIDDATLERFAALVRGAAHDLSRRLAQHAVDPIPALVARS